MEYAMFKRAIVRKPSQSIINGLTTAKLGKPDYHKTLQQHDTYVDALKKCGLEIISLPADELYPDATFVEDVALLTKTCAIITRPGAASRRGETKGIKKILQTYYTNIEEIAAPGTVEAGDIMMVDNHYYIGISDRTNQEGANQVISYLETYGMTGSVIELKEVLHLKTGLAYLENNHLVASGEFITHSAFQQFNIIAITEGNESYAANCIWVNDRVILPEGYDKTKEMITAAGYETIEVDVSEFRKVDGGLSCLSLRF